MVSPLIVGVPFRPRLALLLGSVVQVAEALGTAVALPPDSSKRVLYPTAPALHSLNLTSAETDPAEARLQTLVSVRTLPVSCETRQCWICARATHPPTLRNHHQSTPLPCFVSRVNRVLLVLGGKVAGGSSQLRGVSGRTEDLHGGSGCESKAWACLYDPLAFIALVMYACA